MGMSTTVNLAGKIAVVTGGANGIGHEIARSLAAAGAKVAIGDLNGDAARTAAQQLNGNVLGVALDVTDAKSYADFLTAVKAKWGAVDILVNNAGIMWVGSFDNESDQTAEQQIAVNLLGVIRGVKLVAPAMVARGSGHIITVASAASVLTTPGEATYSASKHGVLGYLKAVRTELRRTPVKFSAIMPAVVDTRMATGTGTGAAKLLQPSDIANAVMGVIERPRFEVTVPGYINPLLRFVSILPRPLHDALMRRLVPDQVKVTDHGLRAKYESQFKEGPDGME